MSTTNRFRASILAGKELLFNIRLFRSGRISQLVAAQKLRIEAAVTAVLNEFHARRARAWMAQPSRAWMSTAFGAGFGATVLTQLTRPGAINDVTRLSASMIGAG